MRVLFAIEKKVDDRDDEVGEGKTLQDARYSQLLQVHGCTLEETELNKVVT